MTATDGPAPVTVTGTVHPPDYFRVVERDGIDWDVWTDVLRGRIAVAHFRGALAAEACERIARALWDSPALQAPAGTRKGYRLGPDLVGSADMDAYLDAVERTRPEVDAVLAAAGDRSVPALLAAYRAYAADRGLEVRLAEHGGRRAAAYKLRVRTSAAGFALLPHDDAETLRRAPHLKGFEVQDAAHICAAVACVENDRGGELVCWNLSPDQESRAALGYGYDTRGYPERSLAGYQRLTVPVRPGDLHVFDAGLVHAVGRPAGTGTHRTGVQWNMAFHDATTILQWS
ncbi:hypothetical protein [Streptomyces antimicrobicus]|uniref:Fe2OG dioxygenase domain-containing protein n=1 Tax=Streptomyces antimicrobicus TaxID=2883108 RepID=A0ABS8BF11_9ACTN|nr:hypothetical protein [Streptomyces antimicrobicus]MCB5183222.1 hypothetical protein [Streptomyces antimicrobicus]